MKQYIVDAFTPKPFQGNPAAICVLESWPQEEWMKKVAGENNLSETAFLVPKEDGYHLRWFTPKGEIELCGHATLASAFVILNYVEPQSQKVKFYTMSGELEVRRKENLYEMNFPTYLLQEIPVSEEMEKAFGMRPIKALLGLHLICIFDDEKKILELQPDQTLLLNLPGTVQNVTAKSKNFDCISRSFCPKHGIIEDPVCGSAHCQIGDYWSKELNKEEIIAYQASKRGGIIHCKPLKNGRIQISGEATLFAISEIYA